MKLKINSNPKGSQNKMGKGQDNERDLCKLFSLWWTEGKRDDIFWRTAGSGARARVRTDSGKKVYRGYGDMMAEDLIGQPLINACTFEFKKGYKALSLLDCIASDQKKPVLIQFIQEAEKDAKDAGNIPILVFQKKYKKTIICIPFFVYSKLKKDQAKIQINSWELYHKDILYTYILIKLFDFFNWVKPKDFLKNF